MNFVYFVQPEEGGPIKIGVTNDIDRRLAGLQTGSPVRLVLRHHIEAGTSGQAYALERDLHGRFHSYRLHGEWFEASAELAKLANGLATPTYAQRKHRLPVAPDAQLYLDIESAQVDVEWEALVAALGDELLDVAPGAPFDPWKAAEEDRQWYHRWMTEGSLP